MAPDRAIRPVRAAIAAVVLFCVAGLFSGCSLAPGLSSAGFSRAKPRTIAFETERPGPGEIPDSVEFAKIDAALLAGLDRERLAQRQAGPSLSLYQRRVGATGLKPLPQIPPGQPYRIGRGDILSITVWLHPELTSPAGDYRGTDAAGIVVNEDGTIYFPRVGAVPVEGLTVWEVRRRLMPALDRYIPDVQLDVRLSAFRSQRVQIDGEVRKPGPQMLSDIPLTLLEAIQRCGGLTPEADGENLTLTRDGETYRINLLRLYENGDLSQNLMLQKGDVIQVPNRSLNQVFVYGEFRKPTAFTMNKTRMSLAELIATAGGVGPLTADPGNLYVLRPGTGKPRLFHLDARSADALLLAERFQLEPRDIVYVDAAEVVRWNRLISNLLPLTQIIWSSAHSTQLPEIRR